MSLIAVTGGAGFIGSHVVDELVRLNHEVNIIDNCSVGTLENVSQHKLNSKVSFFNLDIRDEINLGEAMNGVESVIHLAGIGDIVPSINQPKEYLEVNVQGTVNVLETCRKLGINKLIYAASSSCYGLAKTPTKESHQISTKYPYALSKYLGELAVLHWREVYNMNNISLRIFNAYGPRSKTNGAYGAVIGVFMAQKIAGHPFTIVGDGSQKRDFLFVTDAARAFVKAAFADRVDSPIMNLGTGISHSVNELVELLGGSCIYIPKRPGEPEETLADISLIKSQLGWEPTMNFQSGINEILKNSEYWSKAPVWSETEIEIATQDWFKYLQRGEDD